jgi:hypothetical protein
VIDVDLLEDLDGPATEEERKRALRGAYTVCGHGGHDIDLVPSKFDQVLAPPVRVHGRFVYEGDPRVAAFYDTMCAGWGDCMDEPLCRKRPRYVLVVERVVALDLGRPIQIASFEALGSDGLYDRKLVEVEGSIESGFEVHRIGPMWVSYARFRSGAIPQPSGPGRFVGILHAKPGARYGHMGGYEYELVLPLR